MSLEKYLIDHCASTLASLKMGSLFNVDYDSEEELFSHVAEWNRMLNGKGVYMAVLRSGKGKRRTALIYVYRRRKLIETLEQADVAAFLSGCGYGQLWQEGEPLEGDGHMDEWSRQNVLDQALEILRFHLAEEEFPHEIGVFLDYPLGDVIGFIENHGKNFKCTGCWKVYCDQQNAEKMFGKFKKCKAVYQAMWESGRSVCQLTVAR